MNLFSSTNHHIPGQTPPINPDKCILQMSSQRPNQNGEQQPMFGWKLANHLFISGLKPEADPDENLTMNGNQITKLELQNPCGHALSDAADMFEKTACIGSSPPTPWTIKPREVTTFISSQLLVKNHKPLLQ